MSSIFDGVKGFTEANAVALPEAKQAGKPAIEKVMMVKVSPERYSEFANAVTGLNGEVIPSTSRNKPHAYYVVVGDDVESNELSDYLKKTIAAGGAVSLGMDQADKHQFNEEYLKSVKEELIKAATVVDAGGEMDRRTTAALAKIVRSARRKYRMLDDSIEASQNPQQKKTWHAEKSKIEGSINAITAKVEDAESDRIRGVSNILNGIDYANKDTAVFQLASAVTAINIMKKEGTLGEHWNRVFAHKIIEIKEKLNMPPDAFKQGIENGVGTNLAYYLTKFIYGDQKDVQQVADEYAIVMEALDAQRRQLDPDTYERLKKMAHETMETKVAVLKGIKEHPELVVDKGDRPEDTGNVAIAPTEGAVMEYVMKVRLPLGKSVVIEDVEQFKSKGKAGKGDEDQKYARSVLARTEVTLFNLMGYNPKGTAAAVISAYDPLRRHAGEVLQIASKDTIGLLASVVAGKAGKNFGTGVGRFLKYELVQDPMQVNPALADGEIWLRNKFNVFRLLDLEKKHRAFENPEPGRHGEGLTGRITEDAAPGAAPVSGVAPGGDGFNLPGMIGGMGDPVPATKDKPGSGDNYNPRAVRRKKKKQISENVLDFNSFMDALYTDK